MFLFKKKKPPQALAQVPAHIGVIMDGNGRWAKRRGLPRNAGHRAGAETLRRLTEYADGLGVKTLTAYVFSTENWKRPPAEVDGIMNLLLEYLSDAKRTLGGKNARIRVIGDFAPFSPEIREKIKETEEFTKNNTGIVLVLALNYGGQHEIVQTVNKLLRQGKAVTEQSITENLYTAEFPPLDLILRPSGEYRLSNFLLWQSAYAELWFDDVLWPDFKPQHLDKAIRDYQQRHRRFGA